MSKEYIVFDFDVTLIEGDSIKLFCKWVSKSFLGFLIYYHLVSRLLNIFEKKDLKRSRAMHYVNLAKFQNKNISDFNIELKKKLFWDSLSLINEKKYATVVISASYEEIIGDFVKKELGCELITNRINIDEKDVNGRNKVSKFKRRYPNSEIMIAYGNSKGDFPMMREARKSFLRVKNGNLELWKS